MAYPKLLATLGLVYFEIQAKPRLQRLRIRTQKNTSTLTYSLRIEGGQ
jgi:hypothetical protein